MTHVQLATVILSYDTCAAHLCHVECSRQQLPPWWCRAQLHAYCSRCLGLQTSGADLAIGVRVFSVLICCIWAGHRAVISGIEVVASDGPVAGCCCVGSL
jgi:hypothetical protein